MKHTAWRGWWRRAQKPFRPDTLLPGSAEIEFHRMSRLDPHWPLPRIGLRLQTLNQSETRMSAALRKLHREIRDDLQPRSLDCGSCWARRVPCLPQGANVRESRIRTMHVDQEILGARILVCYGHTELM